MSPLTINVIRPVSPPLSETGSENDSQDRKRTFERQLGHTEASYFLPSREHGVNDMILHLGFTAPKHLISRRRLSTAWAVMRARHPLLASRIVLHDYDDIRFSYTSFASTKEAVRDANDNVGYMEAINLSDYLNGVRLLSSDRLSYILVTQPYASSYLSVHSLPSPPLSPTPSTQSLPTESDPQVFNYDMVIAVTHYAGDGMSMHALANDLFILLGNEALTDDDLTDMLSQELCERWWGGNGPTPCEPQGLPPSLEDQLPPLPATNIALRRLASKVDFQNSQRRYIGGHSFPRQSLGSRNIVIRRLVTDETRTKAMLKTCKNHGVSISSALFAMCNLSWARSCSDRLQKELPIMIYSAINLRPYLRKSLPDESYKFLSIGYFNVVLPSFFPASPGDVARTFWHRAKLAKDQSAHAGKNPMLVSRQREMSKVRVERARAWAREDDESGKSVPVPITPLPPVSPASSTASFPLYKSESKQELRCDTPPPPPPKRAQVPSTCLVGASLMGNLDALYKHSAYPSIRFHTMSGAPRQRSGGMLLYGYTFVGKLWIDLVYDDNAFDRAFVNKFWGEFEKGMEEML